MVRITQTFSCVRLISPFYPMMDNHLAAASSSRCVHACPVYLCLPAWLLSVEEYFPLWKRGYKQWLSSHWRYRPQLWFPLNTVLMCLWDKTTNNLSWWCSPQHELLYSHCLVERNVGQKRVLSTLPMATILIRDWKNRCEKKDKLCFSPYPNPFPRMAHHSELIRKGV